MHRNIQFGRFSGCNFTLALVHITSCVWQVRCCSEHLHHCNICIRGQEWYAFQHRFQQIQVLSYENEIRFTSAEIFTDADNAVVKVQSADSVPQRISGA